jgi:hypothetical protein
LRRRAGPGGGLLPNLIFRVFRMLLILSIAVGALAILFPVIEGLDQTPPQADQPPASSPAAR